MIRTIGAMFLIGALLSLGAWRQSVVMAKDVERARQLGACSAWDATADQMSSRAYITETYGRHCHSWGYRWSWEGER